jgi:hypothetical protein
MMRNGTEITHKPGKSTIAVVIGDKIELAVNVISTDGAPAIDSWQWTIPGIRVEGFTVDEKSGVGSTGTTDELSESECQADDVSFHWVDGGSNRVVSCSTIVQSVTLTVDAKFDVEGITSTFTCAIGDVGVNEILGRDDWRLHFGWNSSSPYANGRPEGVEFAYSASSAPAGIFAMRQLVTSVTHEKQMTAGGTWKTASGSDYLDTNLFMPDAVDSPYSELLTPAYLNYETSTTFSTWLMYKPNSPGAIFVPLRKIDWFWSGKATRSGTTWSLTASDKPSVAPVSTETVEFPEWTHNISDDQPQFQ